MKFYDTLDWGICNAIDQICGSNSTTFPFKTKSARVNEALDRYFSLAFKADRQWNFDDINNTSPPIDTQNIVSGTNRYKVSSFTEKVLSLIKLEILNDSAKGLALIPETLDSFGNVIGVTSGSIGDTGGKSFQDVYIDASSGIPTHYIKYGDFIYLRPNPNYSETSGLKVYFNRPASKFTFTGFTVTSATPAVFTATAHGLSANDIVILETTGALYTGLTADTEYYVISTGLTVDAFELALTQGGTALNTSGSQSGNHSFLKVSKEPGIPSVHHSYLARRASLPFLLEKRLAQKNDIFTQIQEDEREISEYFSGRTKDVRPQLGIYQENNR